MNKKGQGWTLPSIFGIAGIILLVTALFGEISWGFGALGVLFIIIAIALYTK